MKPDGHFASEAGRLGGRAARKYVLATGRNEPASELRAGFGASTGSAYETANWVPREAHGEHGLTLLGGNTSGKDLEGRQQSGARLSVSRP
jgi:hypothetical protein